MQILYFPLCKFRNRAFHTTKFFPQLRVSAVPFRHFSTRYNSITNVSVNIQYPHCCKKNISYFWPVVFQGIPQTFHNQPEFFRKHALRARAIFHIWISLIPTKGPNMKGSVVLYNQHNTAGIKIFSQILALNRSVLSWMTKPMFMCRYCECVTC